MRMSTTKVNRKVWMYSVICSWEGNPTKSPRGPVQFHIERELMKAVDPSDPFVKESVIRYLEHNIFLLIQGRHPADPRKYFDCHQKVVTRGYRSSDAHVIVSGVWRRRTDSFVNRSKKIGNNQLLLWSVLRSQ